MQRHAAQGKLFDLGQRLPNGLVYRPDFVTREEELQFLETFAKLPLKHPSYGEEGEYQAKRRMMSFGWTYDFDNNKLVKGPPLPLFFQPLQRRIAKWLGIPANQVVEALINEYPPGAQIGWHRDSEEFESIIGISLQGWARMRFRPLSSLKKETAEMQKDVIVLEVEPRSAYIMQKEVRWKWQHSVAPVPELRYSITFRTLPSSARP